jgi:hypothetical protein
MYHESCSIGFVTQATVCAANVNTLIHYILESEVLNLELAKNLTLDMEWRSPKQEGNWAFSMNGQ